MTLYLSLIVHISDEMKWNLSWNWTIVGSFSVAYIPWGYQFTEFTLHNLCSRACMTFVLDGCSCNSLLHFMLMPQMSVCSACRANDFLGDVSMLAPIWLNFSLFCICLLCVLVNIYNLNCCWEPFLVFVNLWTVWSSQIMKHLSEFTWHFL